MKANFTNPVICPKDKNMGKEWFVHFRWTDPISKKRYSIKKRADLNSIEDKKERIKSAQSLVKIFEARLIEGWNPVTDSIQKEEEELSLIQWLDNILLTKKSLKSKSYTDYEDISKIFKLWLKEKKFEHLYPGQFSNKLALQYLDYCVIQRANSGRTRNNQMNAMKTFFFDIFKRDKERYGTLENPFAKIDKLPEREGNNYALTKEERLKLKNYLYPKHKEFYIACCFMFYCCLRRPDIANMKFKDIDRKNMVLLTHSTSSKSLRQEAVRIPAAMNKILDEMQIDKYPGTWYIFSSKFKPGPEMIKRIGYFSEFFRVAADEIGIDPAKSFYSFKHSGACEYYELTKDPIAVMKQLRHTELKVTLRYLRSLGQLVDDVIKYANIEM